MTEEPQPSEQLAVCTQDDTCTADEHQDDCPIETKLREEFGY